MTLARAIEVLNERRHRGSTGWNDRAKDMVWSGGGMSLTPFEAVAVARAYEDVTLQKSEAESMASMLRGIVSWGPSEPRRCSDSDIAYIRKVAQALHPMPDGPDGPGIRPAPIDPYAPSPGAYPGKRTPCRGSHLIAEGPIDGYEGEWTDVGFGTKYRLIAGCNPLKYYPDKTIGTCEMRRLEAIRKINDGEWVPTPQT